MSRTVYRARARARSSTTRRHSSTSSVAIWRRPAKSCRSARRRRVIPICRHVAPSPPRPRAFAPIAARQTVGHAARVCRREDATPAPPKHSPPGRSTKWRATPGQ